MALFVSLYTQVQQCPKMYQKYRKITSKRSAVSSNYVFMPTAVSTSHLKDDLKDQTPIIRRSGNYQPPNWGFDYIESLKNDCAGPSYVRKWNELKEQVKTMLIDEDGDLLDGISQLELISDLERLGVSYHFHEKIRSCLSGIQKGFVNFSDNDDDGKNLYATALAFRILRQHGFHVSQDVFEGFMDAEGGFSEDHEVKGIKGVLELYEASHLATEDENTLDLARDVAARVLNRSLDNNVDPHMAELVQHALELPLHWRMQRVEAKWFIDVYEKRQDFNPVLLEFAKLDFNIVQAAHQEDLKYASRWWRSTGLAERLGFGRDRLVENFLWTVGETFEPQYGYCRRISTKVNALLTIVDDIYDVYGTLEELQLFTHAIERWDIEVIDDLPDYMRICYFSVYNNVNELAYDAMREQGVDIISHLRKAWVDICKAYLQEAKWYYSGYVPTLEEYMENAWISVAAPAMLVHVFFCVTNPITKEALQSLDNYYQNIIRISTTNVRYANDLGTSTDKLKRGDVPKSIQCIMHETGACEEEARRRVKFLIGETWKLINRERVAENSPFSSAFIDIVVNTCRMAQGMYLYGDGHGHSNPQTKTTIRSLLFEPIPLPQALK